MISANQTTLFRRWISPGATWSSAYHWTRALLLGLALVGIAGAKVAAFEWDLLPALPPSAGTTNQPGVAGPFAGVHNGVLIVAGGANFPDKMPWDGGAKVWWDDIWVLERRPDGSFGWVGDKRFQMPRRLGYGVSVSTPDGLICAGGHDATKAYAEVFLLSWDPKDREIKRTELPPMPQPLTFMAGALVGETLYVAGGQHAMQGPEATPSSAFWALDLRQRNRPEQFRWIKLPSWPGPPRILPVAATFRLDGREQFFFSSGRVPRAGSATEILSDAYAFDPRTQAWRKLASVGGGAGVSVMAGSAVAAGDEILIFGGDRGDVFLELERHDLAVAALRKKLTEDTGGGRAAAEREIERHLAAKRAIYMEHPGFNRDVYAYAPRGNTWRVVARSPVRPQVTTSAVPWGDAIVIPSGEIRPGVRTPDIVRVRPVVR